MSDNYVVSGKHPKEFYRVYQSPYAPFWTASKCFAQTFDLTEAEVVADRLNRSATANAEEDWQWTAERKSR